MNNSRKRIEKLEKMEKEAIDKKVFDYLDRAVEVAAIYEDKYMLTFGKPTFSYFVEIAKMLQAEENK